MFNDDNGMLARIINSRELDSKIDSIVSQATETMQPGEMLYKSLALSGAAAGVEQSQRYFQTSSNSVVNLLRSTLGRIDAIILSTSEPENITALQEMRKSFSDLLIRHSQHLYDAYATSVEDALGLDKKHITGKTSLLDYGSIELQKIGFNVYLKAPFYFHAWNHFQHKGTLSTIECKCSSCMVEKLKQEEVTISDTVTSSMEVAGGLDKLFSSFGGFVLAEARDTLAKIVGGIEETHIYDTASAVNEANDAISSIRKRPAGN